MCEKNIHCSKLFDIFYHFHGKIRYGNGVFNLQHLTHEYIIYPAVFYMNFSKWWEWWVKSHSYFDRK